MLSRDCALTKVLIIEFFGHTKVERRRAAAFIRIAKQTFHEVVPTGAWCSENDSAESGLIPGVVFEVTNLEGVSEFVYEEEDWNTEGLTDAEVYRKTTLRSEMNDTALKKFSARSLD